MRAKHTSGPWAFHPIKAQVDCAIIGADGNLIPICQLLWPTDERSEEETEANAYLIAASPDLRAACERILPHNLCVTNLNVPDDTTITLNVSMAALREIHAAIEKSKGNA